MINILEAAFLSKLTDSCCLPSVFISRCLSLALTAAAAATITTTSFRFGKLIKGIFDMKEVMV